MAETANNNKELRKNVENFLNAYKGLAPDGKVAFLVELDRSIKNKAEREKRMFIALLKAARDNENIDRAIEAMEKAEKGDANA